MPLSKLLLRRNLILSGRRLFRTSSMTSISLHVIPKISLYDVPTTVIIEGLIPMQPYTLSTFTTDSNKEFRSSALYFADAAGKIDVAKNASVGGSYKGVFPSGLFTTLRPCHNTQKYSVLYKKDTSTPLQVTLSVFEGNIANYTKDSKPLTTIAVERYLMAPGVQRILIKGNRVRGVLYLPSGSDPKPGVLNLNGMQNGIMEHRSALLASRGIASLTLAWAGYDGLPLNCSSFHIETIEEAIEILLSQDNVIPDRCGVISYCVGSTLGILSAIHFDKIKAVVATQWRNYFVALNILKNNNMLMKAVPFEEYVVKTFEGITLTHPEYKTLELPSELLLPIKDVPEDTSFLFISGTKDSEYCAHRSGIYYFQKHKKYNYEDIVCEGAGHIIDPPYIPHLGTTLFNYWNDKPHYEVYPYEFSSNDPQDTVKAQEAVWPKVQLFIKHNIRDKSVWYQNTLQKRS